LYLEKLYLINYRNYLSLENNFSAQVNILIGNNAQGKTNLIEAIYYLSIGKSYRPARDLQLTNWNADYFCVSGLVRNNFGKTKLDITYRNNEQTNKEIKVNSSKINKNAELLGNLTTILFAPEDLNIIKGPPSERRNLLDNDIAQVSPAYNTKLQQYNRILNQRNYLLRKIAMNQTADKQLDVWNQQFLEMSNDIVEKRLEVLEKLTPLTRLMQRRLTEGQENLEIRYILNKDKPIKRNSEIKNLLLAEMNKYRGEEFKRGITLCGPHRDDLLISLNGNDLKYYGSQGQHRTTVLAVKLAELEFFKAESGEYPVLLLDDVLSELDQQRRDQLLNTIQEKNIQCFITTTEDNSFLWHKNTTLQKFHISEGKLVTQ